MPRRSHLGAVAALTALAVVLRVPTLGHQSFWIDEGAVANLLQLPLGDFLHELRVQTSPPLPYPLVFGWSELFGTSEVAMRSLSALFGCVTVPVAYWIGARIGLPRTGVIAAAFVATSPEMVWFSQEARPYSLLVLLSALTLYFTVRIVQEGGARPHALWALSASAAIATHYFMIFVVVPEAVWVLSTRRNRRRAVAATAAVGAVGLCLLPLLSTQANRGYWPYYSDLSVVVRARAIPGALLFGEGRPIPAVALVATGLLLTGMGLVLAVREYLPRLALTRGRSDAVAVIGVIAVGVAGLMTPFLFAFAGADYISPHNFLGIWFALAFGVAAGCAARGARSGAALAAVICVLNVAIVGIVYFNPRYQRDDWRGAVASLGAPHGGRALVFPLAHVDAVTYYVPDGRALPRDGALVDEIDVFITGRPGDPPPPWPAVVPPPAPGFREVSRDTVQRIRIVRFRATDPVRVSGAELATARDGDSQVDTLLQDG